MTSHLHSLALPAKASVRAVQQVSNPLLDEEIDQRFYLLYGLTEEEIGIVEGK